MPIRIARAAVLWVFALVPAQAWAADMPVISDERRLLMLLLALAAVAGVAWTSRRPRR